MSDSTNLNDYVTTDLRSTIRNNGFKINGKRFISNEAKHFFFNRIINIWNSLLVNSNNQIDALALRHETIIILSTVKICRSLRPISSL